MAMNVVLRGNHTTNQIFGLCGSFTALVNGLMAFSSLRVALPGNSRRRQRLVGGGCLEAVAAMAVAYISGTVGQQSWMLISFTALLPLEALRAWWGLPPTTPHQG